MFCFGEQVGDFEGECTCGVLLWAIGRGFEAKSWGIWRKKKEEWCIRWMVYRNPNLELQGIRAQRAV